jgi:hypothetical protein
MMPMMAEATSQIRANEEGCTATHDIVVDGV